MHDITARFHLLPGRLDTDTYNYRHFRTRHLISDLRRTFAAAGPRPGQLAPDFELPRAGNGSLRLRELRGKPVLLRFGSLTCPVTIGLTKPMKLLHEKWGEDVLFIDVLVRQAHPGSGVEAYDELDRKAADAGRYQTEHGIPWPVLVDDVPGKVHQVYGGLSNPAFLIDSAGRISFYSLWSNPAALDAAIKQLLKQDGRGVVEFAVDRRPALMPIFTGGWPAIRRGLPQSYIDLETALPGAATALLAGHVLKPWLEKKPQPAVAHPSAATRSAVPVLAVAGAAAGAAIGVLLYRRLRA